MSTAPPSSGWRFEVCIHQPPLSHSPTTQPHRPHARNSIERTLFTVGLAPVGVHDDDVYRATFKRMEVRSHAIPFRTLQPPCTPDSSSARQSPAAWRQSGSRSTMSTERRRHGWRFVPKPPSSHFPPTHSHRPPAHHSMEARSGSDPLSTRPYSHAPHFLVHITAPFTSPRPHHSSQARNSNWPRTQIVLAPSTSGTPRMSSSSARSPGSVPHSHPACSHIQTPPTSYTRDLPIRISQARNKSFYSWYPADELDLVRTHAKKLHESPRTPPGTGLGGLYSRFEYRTHGRFYQRHRHRY